jgi:hypothetical protein
MAILESSFCFATPSTHIWAPSTDIQPFGIFHITGDMYLPTEMDSAGNRPDAITDEGLTVGLLPFEKFNIEAGFDHKTGLGDLDNYPMYFNAKAGMPENAFNKFFPALAVGVYDIGTKGRKTNFNVVYGKAAKTFSAGSFSLGRLSAGYFYGNDQLLLNEDGEKDNIGFFGAWERTITEISDKLWLCLEYQGTKSIYGCWNIGGSWKFSENVSMLVGFERYNDRNLADTVTLQFDIDFDVFSKISNKT